MKKKIIYYLLLFAIILSISACGKEEKTSTSQTSGRQSFQDEPSTVQSDTTKSSDSSPDNGNSEEDSAEVNADRADAELAEIDVDLTELSSTMIYSEVYNMMVNPEDYVGKMVRMNGQFSVYQDQSTGSIYYAVIIADATACCSQGLEFVLAGNYTYPDDYPEIGTELTATGTFQTYEENGAMYCHLTDAEIN